MKKLSKNGIYAVLIVILEPMKLLQEILKLSDKQLTAFTSL